MKPLKEQIINCCIKKWICERVWQLKYKQTNKQKEWNYVAICQKFSWSFICDLATVTPFLTQLAY